MASLISAQRVLLAGGWPGGGVQRIVGEVEVREIWRLDFWPKGVGGSEVRVEGTGEGALPRFLSTPPEEWGRVHVSRISWAAWAMLYNVNRSEIATPGRETMSMAQSPSARNRCQYVGRRGRRAAT